MKEEYFESGQIKSRTSLSADTVVLEIYFEEENQPIRSVIKSLGDTVYTAWYYAMDGRPVFSSLLDKHKVVNVLNENNEWLIGPQDGAKYLSVINGLDFPVEGDEYFIKSITSDGIYVHLPQESGEIKAILFEHEAEIRSDSTGFFHGTHTYFSIPQ
ncbi:hypothetical protein [uncultured Imperialibacter sp.]|uniref:hypothetical protein n=1 Tax=uncultured Imperialibacter sp. TaxID=1672639 RepID=UPI0030DA30C7